jgi:hypothetical protein
MKNVRTHIIIICSFPEHTELGNMLKAFATQVCVPNVVFALPCTLNHKEIARLNYLV